MDTKPNHSNSAGELAGLLLRLRKIGRFPEQDHFKHRQMHFLFTLSKLIPPGKTGVKASEMSQSLHITRGGISQMINEMESIGMVERFSDPSDRRVVLIRPTESGKKQMDDAFHFLQKQTSEMTSFLGEEDTRHLIRILNRIIPYLLERHQQHPG